ncbi:hypothetical protein F886_00041 [Acinetobacter sp. NIPH 542]|uniref:hypothetical protein n=1 Tax=Acinetobacter sp. NIPH 542 TaxID=1217688 RepID=UPI0002D01754|nr:hypothetical protein [Acinetobacter sp. NIPH 542]ENX48240.1 hypothetical protein F886_00041 [Acinetobacter sp. NIPH 542]
MKKIIVIAMLASTVANAEIVTNSKGQKIELKSDGTWAFVNKNKTTQVEDGKEFLAVVNDGKDKPVKIKVFAKVDNGPIRLFSETEVVDKIRTAAEVAKISLKNKYSFIPKVAYIEQEGTGLTINLEYTAENSYGADTIGHQKVNFALDSNDKLKMY